MAKAFDVTTVANAISLDADRKATITVTATSVLTRPVRGRFKVKPVAPAADGWFTVAPEAGVAAPAAPSGQVEREFPAAKTTHTFVVNVAVPAEVAAGVYNVAFLLEAEDNTDVDFDLSSAVAMTVAEKKEVKKPFPWKIPVAILAALVLAVVALLAIRSLTGGEDDIAVDVPPVTQARITVTNFTGQDALPATTAASQSGLAVRLEQRVTVTALLGKVVTQSLPVGTVVDNGTTITFQVGSRLMLNPIIIPPHVKVTSALDKTVSEVVNGK